MKIEEIKFSLAFRHNDDIVGENKSSSLGVIMSNHITKHTVNTPTGQKPAIGDSRELLSASRKGRAILLCDIENLAYDFRKKGFSREDVCLVHDRIMTLIGHLRPYPVIAASHYFWKPVMTGWNSTFSQWFGQVKMELIWRS